MMNALILAGGLGSRLKHKTSDRPKYLTLVHGKTILDYQMEILLASKDIDKIFIVVGYLGQKIIDHMTRHYPEAPVSYIWNHEFDTSNSSYSFWLAHSHIQNAPYVHIHCDILFSHALFQELIHSPHPNILSIRKDVPLGNQMENVTLEGERITAMSITTRPDSVAKAFGLAKFSVESSQFLIRRIADHIHQGDKNQNYYGIIREAVKTLPYYALDAGSHLLLEVNTLDDLQRADELWEKT